jgi:hypothetical protein
MRGKIGGTVERRNGGTVERWNGGTVERWNGGTVERWNGGTVERGRSSSPIAFHFKCLISRQSAVIRGIRVLNCSSFPTDSSSN